MIMREIRPDPDYSNDLPIYDFLNQGISGADSAKKKVIAAYLAQEGIEFFRNIRDTEMLYQSDKNQAWINFETKLQAGKCDTTSGCYFDDSNLFGLTDITYLSINPCDSNGCPALLYDQSDSCYGYSTGVDSGFSRKMSFQTISANEIKIISQVTWKQGISTGTVSFSENLDSWIE